LISKARGCKLDLYWIDTKMKYYKTRVRNLKVNLH
jgi:hypothetical protein